MVVKQLVAGGAFAPNGCIYFEYTMLARPCAHTEAQIAEVIGPELADRETLMAGGILAPDGDILRASSA